MKDYDVFDYKGREYHTGMLPAKEKLCSVARFPVQKFERSAIQGLIEDPNRFKARDQFGPSFIINQGSLGSCNGWAAATALMRARVRAGLANVQLSGNFLYSRINDDRDQGSHLDDGMEWIRDHGIAPWNPKHAGKYKSSSFSPEDLAAMGRFKAFEVYGVDDELELATGLALGFIAVLAVHVTRDFMKLDRSGIVKESNGPGNHAVVCDDGRISSGGLLFDFANSWGVNGYGADGRGLLTWSKHLSGPNKNHYFYLVRATTHDPQDSIPDLKG